MGYLWRPPSTICFQISKLIFDTLLGAWGALYHTRHLSQLKTRATPLTKPKVGNNFAVLDIYFMRYLWRPPPQFVFKYQSWYLPPCCGIEVHYPTSALKSVKDPRNTVKLSPKWVRILPSLIYFLWDIYGNPSPQLFFKYQNWYLTPCCGIEVHYPT